MDTLNSIHRRTTQQYIDELKLHGLHPDPEEMERDLLEKLDAAIDAENSIRPKENKLRRPTVLTAAEIAMLMAYQYDICRVPCAGENADQDYDLLVMYQPDGDDEGTYSSSETVFAEVSRRFNYQITTREISEILAALKVYSPRRFRCSDPNLIAVNNGIFNYETKRLEPFTRDRIFLTKSHVNYNSAAVNVTIHNDDDGTDWDVESWMQDLSDDPEIVNLLWEIIGAIIRPNIRWNKSAWFYSEKGNNGKGTLCELMRSICGEGAYASIPLADFSKDFMLEPLIRASAIIVDENDVGTFVDRAANLKAIITNDVIQINRKFKMPLAYQFRGFMVQCLNEFPKIKDRSDSFYRRQLFVKFDKCFTGHERKYIKSDYLHRAEVLEYVLKRVLNMNYNTLSEPKSCREALSDYKEFNDPVRQFWNEFRDEFVWDFLPFKFLYDLYKAWYKDVVPIGAQLGASAFKQNLANILTDDDDYFCDDPRKKIRVGNRMAAAEPLILRYNLSDWENGNYRGEDPAKKCTPVPRESDRGLVRKVLRINVSGATSNP